jgi:hypothetical protein
MTSEQPKEYIITAFQLKQLQEYADLDFVCQAIRSRPHPAPAQPAERLGFTEFCHVHCDKHECCTNECERSAYEAARKARDDVLDLIEKWIKEDACPPGKKKGKQCDKGCAMCFVEFLRQHTGQESER